MSGAYGFYQKSPLPFSFDILVHWWFAVVITIAVYRALEGNYPLKGWQTTAAKDACFQRVRYTGKPVHMPSSLHVKEDGIEIGFTVPIDPSTAR